ncbi:hypothetical protein HID58_074529, partial [Brassica napus]
ALEEFKPALVMTGRFLTDRQASCGWMFKLSEWKRLSTYDVDLNTGSSATHIEVIDRKTKRLVEELIDSKILARFDLYLLDPGAKEILQKLSEKHGKKMNTVESALKIASFLKFFKDQINMAEVKYPLQHFKGRKFSIRGLLGKNVNRNAFLDGSLVIFRLAPQVHN